MPVATVREWMDDAFVAAVLTKGEDVQKVVHLGRRFTANQRTALQWQDPICARKGCANRLGLEYDHFEDWADHPHHPRARPPSGSATPATSSNPAAGASPNPMPTGECTFTPPDLKAVADAAATAVQARRRRTRTTGPAPPLPDTG